MNDKEDAFEKKEKMCEYSGLPNTDTYKQEIELYDASKRSEHNSTEFPRIDEDGNRIEWTAC